MKAKNILVIAYQLHYSAGSECAVAMDFARNMGKYHRITMLYGTCRQFHKIGDTAEMEEWTESNNVDNVTFLPVRPSFKSHDFRYSMLGNILFYKEYRKWHKDLKATILDLMDRQHFDLIHYLGPIGYHEPGFITDFSIPVIWGPIGGFETVNLKLMDPFLSLSSFINTVAKNIANKLQYRFDRRVRFALMNSDVVLFAVSSYSDIVKPVVGPVHKSRFLYIPENCIGRTRALNDSKFESGTLNLIFVGRLDSKKGLNIILEALKKVRDKDRIRLHVIGSGPLEEKLRNRSEGLAGTVIWHGSVPREMVTDYMDEAHLMVLPSLLDANTTVVWEAMSVGLPVLAFDHCGFHDTVIDGETGFLIRPESYAKAVSDIAGLLGKLVGEPGILREMSVNVISHRDKYRWENRRIFFNELYESLTNDA